jgi:large-conductance mechanosensitive channel
MADKSQEGEHEQTRVVTTGSTIRIEQPKSQRGHKPKVSVIVGNSTDEFVGGFVDFLREHAVVGLAIGFIIGVQAQTLIKQLVDGFINPAFTLLFGQALSQRTFTLHWHERAANFGWGAFVYGLLNFVFVLATIYAIFRYFKLDRLEKPEKKAAKEA